MTAQLDKMNHFGELNGGVSDPRLVHKVNLLPPHRPITHAECQSVYERICAAYPTNQAAHLTAREELLNLILNGEVP